MHIVERTCTEVTEKGSTVLINISSKPFSAYQNFAAYVLLGDPGAGKTTVFEQEVKRNKNNFYVSARDFITFDNRSDWQNKTLFIDGLDEIRAGSQDLRTPFDLIRTKLDKLECPNFRLSCREADWFGASDHEHLKSVSPDKKVTVLHLDSLTEENIIEILNHNQKISNAKAFIKEAKKKSISELLINPQILNMLIKVVADGNWPETRKQTFEIACKTIIREYNYEHHNAKRIEPVEEKQQLTAAGYLCALQLISGSAGYALAPTETVSDFPYIGDISFDNIKLLNDVVRTKLFKRGASDEQRTPVHRHVAEYMAAQYIAQRIDIDGLPVGRVLALITGDDGVVVTELRGLSAWLAALCKSQRFVIIEHDPLGVVLYGDVQGFTSDEKLQLLKGLQREAIRYPWFRSSNWEVSPFAALATTDMVEEFRYILISADRSEAHQALVECVLDAMLHGTKFVKLEDILLDFVRDATWWLHLRKRALKVIQRNLGNEKFSSDIRIEKLFKDIATGKVEDSVDDLLGYLLTKLYPQKISAAKIFDYFHALKQRNTYGLYLEFWRRQILIQSSDSDIKVLLDECSKRLDFMQPILDEHHLGDLTAGLLSRGLELFGDSIKSERLYEWLSVGLDQYGRSNTGPESYITTIRSWLENYPEIQKKIIHIGMKNCTGKESFKYCMNRVHRRLFYAKKPLDFGHWCLTQMKIAENDDVAFYLLGEAADALFYRTGDSDLTLEIIQKMTEAIPKYQKWLNGFLVCKIDQQDQEYHLQSKRHETEQGKKKQEWLQFAKSNENNLRQGNVPISLLKDLATAYFGYFIDSKGNTPIERFRNFLENDGELIQSAFEGLRLSLFRDDIPDVSDIIRQFKKKQTYLLCRPILAGIEIFTETSPDKIKQLSAQIIDKALAFRLTDGTDKYPVWYKYLLKTNSKLVSEIYIQYVTSALRSKKTNITGLYSLAYDADFKALAKLVSLPLLTLFPVARNNQLLLSLDELLKAALRYANRMELLILVEEKCKLTSKNSNMPQNIRWLTVGMILAPKKYLPLLTNFVKGKEKRIQYLTGFLADRHDQWSPINELPVFVLSKLIHIIGQFFAPYSLNGTYTVTPSMSAADFVTNLINHLGSQPAKEASEKLDFLSTENGLKSWHNTLQNAIHTQRAIRREANFHHPNIHQVSSTLKNFAPTNAGDLVSLIVDKLHDMGKKIRNSNTDDYYQYWNEDPRRQLVNPKHEDACRDALLSDLSQQLMKFEIDAQPEGQYADDKRADIRVAFGGSDGFEIPIEIKKNSHTNLWYAIHDQLIAKYTREPNTNGFGIYLVFWFGADKTQAAPTGTRPVTSIELENRLRATLSNYEKRKISICVIDVSKPVKSD